MELVLYHYVHCPYCVRVRMALGRLNLKYRSQVLAYDDQSTPVNLVGVKMLPILTVDGKPVRESLDIIRLLDQENDLSNDSDLTAAETFIKLVNNPVHSLAMPYWIYTPEFSDSSRDYFVKQKEAKRGPFPELVKNSPRFVEELNPHLEKLADDLNPYFQSKRLRIQDIMIASHLWGLYIVPEFQFPEKIHRYLQNIKSECRFNYHQDYWS